MIPTPSFSLSLSPGSTRRMKTRFLASLAMAAFVVFAQDGKAAQQIEVPLKQVKGPNNTFHDPEYGVSLTYPAGWELARGFRWGPTNEQTTFPIHRLRRPALG